MRLLDYNTYMHTQSLTTETYTTLGRYDGSKAYGDNLRNESEIINS